jgi:hypothetical protein
MRRQRSSRNQGRSEWWPRSCHAGLGSNPPPPIQTNDVAADHQRPRPRLRGIKTQPHSPPTQLSHKPPLPDFETDTTVTFQENMSAPTTRRTMYNEQQDMLAVLIGGANIVCSLISHWFKSSVLKYPRHRCLEINISLLIGLAVGAAFLFVGTQMRGKERALPLLVASLVMTVFFSGRLWAAPVKEIFPSGILAALR